MSEKTVGEIRAEIRERFPMGSTVEELGRRDGIVVAYIGTKGVLVRFDEHTKEVCQSDDLALIERAPYVLQALLEKIDESKRMMPDGEPGNTSDLFSGDHAMDMLDEAIETLVSGIWVKGRSERNQMEWAEIEGNKFRMQHTISGMPLDSDVEIFICKKGHGV